MKLIGNKEICDSRVKIDAPIIVALIYVFLYQVLRGTGMDEIISVLFVAYMLLCDKNTQTSLIMFIISGNEMFNIGSTSIILLFVIGFLCKTFICKGISKHEISKGTFFVSCLLLLVSICEFINGSSYQLSTTVKCFVFTFFSFLILKENKLYYEKFYKMCFRYIALGINCLGIISILFQGIPSISERYSFSDDITINYLGIICALVVTNLLYILIIMGSEQSILDIILACGCCVWGLLTQSRSFILAVFIALFLLLFLTATFKSKVRTIVLLAVMAVGLGIVINISPAISDLSNTVINRVLNPKNDDISNGRYDLWEQTIDVMCNNKHYYWFGAGDYRNLGVLSNNNKLMMAHNVFLETWTIYGWIGTILIAFYYFFVIKNSIFRNKKVKISAINFVPIFIMFCSLFYSHTFVGRGMSLVFVISFLPLTIKCDKECG